MGDKPEQWTYRVGDYRSFLRWDTFELACAGAFALSPHVLSAEIVAPDGTETTVLREEWHDMLLQLAGEEKS